MSGWLIGLRDRPIADHERRQAFIASIVVLAITVGLLALTAPATSTTTHAGRRVLAARSPLGKSPVSPPSIAGDRPSTPGIAFPSVERVARQFLTGYLAYLYGRGSVADIRGASASLQHSLAALPPRVSLAMSARHPHVISLAPATAPAGTVGVSALVSDGGVADYTVNLLVTHSSGRLLVTGMDGA
ncbi:MAG TPA: hypothetical protein VK730_06940 [Solirubrobacteraceae bacterium]|jgi:hypothetical protein|nr:hypothetical protein [Solirubrobacteraceae bacterium]